MKINLDYQIRTVKPTKVDTAIISTRLFDEYVDVSFDEFCKAISEYGQAFCPGHMVGGMEKEFWTEQNIFCLDMELDKKTKQNIKMEEALELLKEYNILPNIIYPTFSHTEQEHRYRIIWFLNENITDERVFNFIQRGLVRFFTGKGVDTGCVNCNRIFNGSNKGCFYKNEDNTLSVPSLWNALEMLFRKDNNASKNTKAFAEKVGVNLINGYLDCKVCRKEDLELDTLPETVYFSNDDTLKENYIINFTSSYSFDDDKMNIENNKFKNQLVRNFNFDKLNDKCRFYREVMSGDLWLEHNSLFYFLTNLLQVEGGTAKIKELVDVVIKETKKQEYHEKANYIEYTVKQANKKGVYPTPCSHLGCPYYGECQSESNMVDFIHPKRNQAAKVKDGVKVREIEEVREDLVSVFAHFFDEEKSFIDTINAWDNEIKGIKTEQDIWFCKAPTGIGKTETFINVVKDYINKGVLYCAPTHALLQDVRRRLLDAGFVENEDFMTYPELPTFEEREYIEKLYNAGAYATAAQELKALGENNKQIKDYVEKKTAVEKFNKLVLTTHSRAIVSPMKINPKYVIFDEDVILSTLVQFKTIKMNDLYYIATEIARSEIKDHKILLDLFNTVNTSTEGIVAETPRSILFNKSELAKSIARLIKGKNEYNSNVLDFYNSYCYTKIGDTVYYVVKRDFGMLPPESKILCLSATLDREISRTMFPNCKWLDLGYVKNQGQLFQVPAKSMSKGCFWRDKKGCEIYTKRLCEKYLGEDYNIITFPEFLHEEKDEIEMKINLRNCAGMDSLQDKDLAVVGTPHVPPVVYYLFAFLLGYNTNVGRTDEKDCQYNLVSRNGFTFYFNTYFHNAYLQNIQFYLIDSALMQCVGRARLINNERRRVLVLSNYLIPQATVFNYTKQEVKLLMTYEEETN